MTNQYVSGNIDTPAGVVHRVATHWSFHDSWGALKTRWSVGRMSYRVAPGIYATGNPDRNSMVFVTGNYKLSFDHLRRALDDTSSWILVIDTRGINIWCAAGKGTFSHKEVVRRIRIHHLDRLVDHRKIILPQLGAPGVAAYKVKEMTGFTVVFGPVQARDIKAFIAAGLRATPAMRQVNFPLVERLKLIPVDIFYGKYYLAIVPLAFFILSGLYPDGYSFELALRAGPKAALNLFSGYLAGCVLAPALLPWIPFRRFSVKGLVTGWFTATMLLVAGTLGPTMAERVSWFLMTGALSSFMAMNFTGSSTFTSLSGVQKEMKIALPVQIAMASVGLLGWIITRFLSI